MARKLCKLFDERNIKGALMQPDLFKGASYSLCKLEAPIGFYAVLKAEVATEKLGNICRACDWRPECNDPATDFSLPRHRCMSFPVVQTITGSVIERTDGCSVVFKRAQAQNKETAEKLRADQMTQRLDMVNRLGNDARAELAQLRQAGATAGNHIPDAGRMVPLTDAQCDKLIAALCPDFTDERFPRDRSIMRELARDAITPTA